MPNFLDLQSKVLIEELDVVGTIMGILYKEGYQEYNVEYFYEGEKRSEWYRDFQLRQL